ncbi:MAG: sigma-70 family RNA polymerase sigma factor [Candidatus Eisenbacteria bacterium]|nr:sigma-70 family RNA polymerase sigma factor [Candidatus Eisenbacteria bacterium]
MRFWNGRHSREVKSVEMEDKRQGSTERDFERLAKESQNKIFNLALKLVGDHEDALDVTQETLIRAFSAYEKFRGDSKPSTWLYRITVNEAKRLLRKRALTRLFAVREQQQSAGEPGLDPSPGQEREERAESVRRMLQSVPRGYREAIVLRYVENMSYGEVAKVLACSEGTAKSRVSRGLRILEKKLVPLMKEEGRGV